jgi:hypothetical protein
LQNHPDLDYKEKHFSAHRSKPGGKEQVGQGSLFRVHLSVVCRLKDGSSFSSVSKQALSDKAKFEFKVLTFNPKIVCNNGRHCITVLSDCSKVSVNLKLEQFSGLFLLLNCYPRVFKYLKSALPPNINFSVPWSH